MPEQPLRKKGRSNTAGKPMQVGQLSNAGKPSNQGQAAITHVHGPIHGPSMPTAHNSRGVPSNATGVTSYPHAPQSLNGQPGASQMDISQWMNCISNQLEDIQRKFCKLDEIERKTDDLAREIGKLNLTVCDVEESTKFTAASYDKLTAEITDIRKENSDLKRQILDTQTRSMRNNLIFSNLPENHGEDTEEAVKQLIHEKLDIQDTINFEVVHRFGSRKNGKPRPIVAKFSSRKDKERVRAQSYKLKGTEYYVSDQYPKEIQDRRNILYPYFKKARSLGMTVSYRNDILVINGRRYTAENVHMCPVKPDPKGRPTRPTPDQATQQQQTQQETMTGGQVNMD